MLIRRALIGVAALGAIQSSAQADHMNSFFFRTRVVSIEGHAPIGINPGDTVSTSFLFDASVPDTDPHPASGVYLGAIREGRITLPVSPYSAELDGSAIAVVDNSALGDVFRTTLSSSAENISVQIELIDAESGAFSSDACPSSLDLANYTGKSDVARIVVEAPSPPQAPPGSTYRVIAAIEFIESRAIYCPCDWNENDVIDSQDMFDFLTDFYSGGGDYNGDGIANSQDFFDFFNCFFTHNFQCP